MKKSLKIISAVRYQITFEDGKLDVRVRTFDNGTHDLKVVCYEDTIMSGVLDMDDKCYMFRDLLVEERTEGRLSRSFDDVLAYILRCPEDFQVSCL